MDIHSHTIMRAWPRNGIDDNCDGLIDNGFTLLCYLGFFPELNPVHIRTHVDLGPQNGFKYWNKNIFNHQFDSEGKLTKYDVGFTTGIIEYTMTIRWREH